MKAPMLSLPFLLTIAAALTFLCSCGGGGEEDDDNGSSVDTGPAFTDVTAESGIVLRNVSGSAEKKMAIPENIGQGAAVLDFDGDGDLDLFIANGDAFPGTKVTTTRHCALYRNDGGFKFTDVTQAAGLAFDGWAHGATAVDFDADGKPDLYVTCYGRKNLFFHNLGDGKFEDVSSQWGGDDPGPSTACAFFDADGDGDLDLYVGNYVHYDPENPPNHGNPCVWKELLVSCGPRGTTPGEDRFYENTQGKLVDQTKKFGFLAKPTYTLGTVTGDFDNDGDVDLYVANDSAANYLFENHGGGKFKQAAVRYGCDMNTNGQPQAGMGVDFGDVDNDGRFDLFVTNFSHDYNTLYRNEATKSGRTSFRDNTYEMMLGDASFRYLSWGTRIVDIDQDGWQDIIAVSGHVYPQVDGANKDTSYAQHNQLFLNRGPGDNGRVKFEIISNDTPGWDKKGVSRGLITWDLDDDGDQDLFIVELDQTPTLLRNDTPARGAWIGLRLKGAAKNRDAIGARVTITDSSGITRYRERTSGASFLSSCDPRLVCGLGSAKGKAKVEVRWPSGKRSEYELAAGQYHDPAEE
ncbi:MAG: RNA-binding protein [Planctomycetes bacterium]|nr:RNA-binding protein [Planctomycetota bacterium]